MIEPRAPTNEHGWKRLIMRKYLRSILVLAVCAVSLLVASFKISGATSADFKSEPNRTNHSATLRRTTNGPSNVVVGHRNSAKVDLNTADRETLIALPGVGTVVADAI